MQFTENEFRDYLFNNHKENISDLIVGRRNPINWKSTEFPPLRFLLQKLMKVIKNFHIKIDKANQQLISYK